MDIKSIKNPLFLKNLTYDELNVLSSEIRDFIISNVSKTGGHLSSNLGIVELTVALHYFYNAPEDKILFDVGHQCYTHKILTGRANRMDSLRQFDGISGFQKRKESEYDCFEAGHSSTCLAAALGMATARDLNKENYEVIAVVGDGSLYSGLSLEALNQIGYQKRNMVIIFNDNNMSISKNVGALNDSINKLRISNSYIGFKNIIKNLLKQTKNGESITKSIHDLKEKIKDKFMQPSVFKNFDIDYIGPIDGYNIKELVKAFKFAKSKHGPVVIHCITTKGKGYKYAQEDTTGIWHGIGPFDIETGKMLKRNDDYHISYSKYVADCVEKQMENNENIVTITPAMISGSCLNGIFQKFPDRSYDVGIAEDLAIEYACGLSLSGKLPFVSVYSSFLQRAYDQLNHDVARMKLPMVIGIDRCSLVGNDGETHHGVYDIGLIRPLPNTIICQGKNANEIQDLIYTGFKSNMPYFIRYPRGNVDISNVGETKELAIGSWEFIINKENCDGYILSYGEDINTLEVSIKNRNLNYSLINCRYIKPIDEELLRSVLNNRKPLYLYTNDMIKGGLSDEILDFSNSNNLPINLKVFGIKDEFVGQGNNDVLKKSIHLDIDSFLNDINN